MDNPIRKIDREKPILTNVAIKFILKKEKWNIYCKPKSFQALETSGQTGSKIIAS